MQASCPSCDAVVSANARACGRCGYRLVEDEGRSLGSPRSLLAPVAGLVALGAVVVLLVALLGGGDAEPEAERSAVQRPGLEVLSAHPLSTREMERLLEERFLGLRDDDTASVSCSGLVAKPAHAVRRCRLLYATGADRLVILLTDARGRERLAALR